MHDLELVLCTRPVHANLTPLLDQLAAAPSPLRTTRDHRATSYAVTRRVALIEWLGNPFDPAP